MPSNTLKNKRMILSRSKRGNGQFARLLADAGAVFLELPLSEMNFRPFEMKILNDDYDWVSFQSPQSVTSFFEQILDPSLIKSFSQKIKFACVGRMTAGVLKEHGFDADLIPGAFTSMALLEEFKKMSPSSILIPRGDLGGGDYIEGLDAAGWKVTDLCVYQNQPVVLDQSDIDRALEFEPNWIPFTSSSGVDRFCHAFASNIFLFKNVKYAAIGPKTKASMQEHGLICSAMPDQSTVEELIKAMSAA